ISGTEFPDPERLAWPIFIVEGSGVEKPIPSLPGQYYYSIDRLPFAVEPVAKKGVRTFLLFGMIDRSRKSGEGEPAWAPSGVVQRGLSVLKEEFGDLTLVADTGLSGYTDHGQAGIVDEHGRIDNDRTLEALAKIAVSQADAGAICVAPSGMMDGQVQHIRSALDAAGRQDVLIMSYSTKFHSDLYDPSPYAVQAPRRENPLTKTYLLPPADSIQAVREARLDESEGADLVMVKPAIFYLDIIAKTRAAVDIPVVAYSVSGEYAMIHASADQHFASLYALAKESLLAIRRAGADLIITYWANQYDKLMEAKL
ncbi:MAG: porphobilinogen synthase, partial [Candidatus Thiodiazotropha sp.]